MRSHAISAVFVTCAVLNGCGGSNAAPAAPATGILVAGTYTITRAWVARGCDPETPGATASVSGTVTQTQGSLDFTLRNSDGGNFTGRLGQDGSFTNGKVTLVGAGGAAAVAELTLAGHDVVLWNRSSATLEPFRSAGGVEYEGVLGEGRAVPRTITADLDEAMRDVDVALMTLPTFSHAPVARALGEAGWPADRG